MQSILLLNIDLIDVEESRFRGVVLEKVQETIASIKRNATQEWDGLINPITVELVGETYQLRAGRQRMAAFEELSKTDPRYQQIRCIDYGTLSPLRRKVIELEENFHRTDFTDKEKILAVNEIHRIFLMEQPGWTMQATAEYLGFKNKAWVSIMTTVAHEVIRKPEGVAAKLLETKGT